MDVPPSVIGYSQLGFLSENTLGSGVPGLQVGRSQRSLDRDNPDRVSIRLQAGSTFDAGCSLVRLRVDCEIRLIRQEYEEGFGPAKWACI